jgi:hypothetical protein
MLTVVGGGGAGISVCAVVSGALVSVAGGLQAAARTKAAAPSNVRIAHAPLLNASQHCRTRVVPWAGKLYASAAAITAER